ncbi:MAG: lysophospholipid acyltransferase family protein [Gemmatimonadaceae bacterium]
MSDDDKRMRWKVRAGASLLRLLASTWRMRSHNSEPLHEARANDKRVIFTLWHGELLPLLWQHRGENIAIVISEHRDGEIVAQIAHSLGYTTVRGSSSKGGSRALIGLMREIDAGRDGAITPDGPRGPAHVFAPGVAVASQRTGAFIAPIRAVASRSWRLNSWDKFLIPKPFARVDVHYGVLTVVQAASPREAAEQAPQLQALLDAVPGS